MRFEKEDKNQSQLSFNSDGSISLPGSIEKDLSFRKKEVVDIWDDYGQDDETHNLQDDVKGFNLYNNGERLNPLVFSNGKSQEDIVNEVISHISKGQKVIFIRGMCGTGKCLDKDTLIFCNAKK